MPSWNRVPIRRRWGDAMAVIAQPIARVIDKAIGTNVSGCGGCAKRQEQLNRLGDRIAGRPVK